MRARSAWTCPRSSRPGPDRPGRLAGERESPRANAIGDHEPPGFPVRPGPGVALAIRGEVRPEEPDRAQVNASTVRRWPWMPVRSLRPGPWPGAGVASRSAATEGRDRAAVDTESPSAHSCIEAWQGPGRRTCGKCSA